MMGHLQTRMSLHLRRRRRRRRNPLGKLARFRSPHVNQKTKEVSNRYRVDFQQQEERCSLQFVLKKTNHGKISNSTM
jgi:hypothetical protein